jgi:hypothetical protein
MYKKRAQAPSISQSPNVNRINRAFTLEFLARQLLKRIDEKSIYWTAAGKVDVGLKNESGAGT